MRKVLLLGLIAVIGVLGISTVALADRGDDGGSNAFSARLIGWEEVPAQVTTGDGSFELDTSSMPWKFTLRYEDM